MVVLNLVDGRSYQTILSAETSQVLVPVAPSQMKVMIDYPLLGIEHIWVGLDHLMFVFALLLLVGGGLRLLLTITAFTVGHSITLALVTLDSLDYPVSLIEFAIALSILIVALELTHKEPNGLNRGIGRLFRRHPWWLV